MWEWMEPRVAELIPTIMIGSAVGTLWRSIVSPRKDLIGLARQALVSLTVGTVIGGSIIQYFALDGFVAAGVASTAAYLSEHALDFFDARGEKLRQGKIDVSVTGDK